MCRKRGEGEDKAAVGVQLDEGGKRVDRTPVDVGVDDDGDESTGSERIAEVERKAYCKGG